MDLARISQAAGKRATRLGNLWATRGSRAVVLAHDVWIHPSANVRTAAGGIARLGVSARIEASTIIKTNGGEVNIGDGVYIGPMCLLSGEGGITIGDNTLIGPQVLLLTSNHVFNDVDVVVGEQGNALAPLRIGRDVWIGGHATILAGITIGDQAVVAAGAVVTRDIPARAIVAGVPAKQIGERGAGQTGTPSL